MILLRAVRLVNWYGFGCVTVPIGTFSLIAGKNGNGKSVLLDAIKYALYGDTVFNKSTENKGSRTVTSYTRGLLDATAGTFMRPADRMPNVYTHIVLELEEEELGRSFVLGTSIDTDSANGFKVSRYLMEDKKIREIRHTYGEEGGEMPYSTAELQKCLGVKMMDAKEGILKFMQRTGLRLNEQQTIAFRRKLRSIMSYDPDAKIDQFIRESVLEERKVDFSKLAEAKNNIDRLHGVFEVIDAEMKELDEILRLFDRLRQARNVIFEEDVRSTYRKLQRCRREKEAAEQQMETAKRQMAEDGETLEAIARREKELRLSLKQAEEHLADMDCARAIQMAQRSLQETGEEKQRLAGEKQKLLNFQNRVSELLSWLSGENLSVEEKNLLSSLTDFRYPAAQKAGGVENLCRLAGRHRDNILSDITRIRDEREENKRQQARQQETINDCNFKKTSFSGIPDYVELKNKINAEFARRGIESEAKFACEYVIGLTDESWRDAIEAYLGKRSYAVLVEPEYYPIADEILNAAADCRAHLFNTRLLMKKRILPEEDSVVRYMEVKHPVARQYFNYQLGRIHAVTKERVCEYENAMSAEGRVSVAMDSFFLRFDKIRFYCLGQETIELNRQRAEERLEKLKEQLGEIESRLKEKEEKRAYLETAQSFFGEYNYDACRLYEEASVRYGQQQAELQKLREAQKNNMEYMGLVSLVENLTARLEGMEEERKAVYESKSRMQAQLEVNGAKYAEKQENISVYEDLLKEYERRNLHSCRKALADEEENGGGQVSSTAPKDRERLERELREAERELTGAQSAYNAHRDADSRLPLTEDGRAAYADRRARIWMDNLQEIRQELEQQTRRYAEIFKNEFVLTVLKSCESAREDLKKINAELSRLKFKSQYEFSVKYVKDGSDYEKILEYAHYLKEREELGSADGQMTLDSATSYSNEKGKRLEEDIKEIIGRIVESNDKERIERFADYRNYMTYEILLTNDVLSKAKLSKQSGYNSGAEVQIPYMLILLSALLMIYNDRLNSTRLVFIDEPFAKMDPANVKIMLGFMKEQKLQMIFCAPDKTELIGSECSVILPVLRTQPDLMEIGIVELHEGV